MTKSYFVFSWMFSWTDLVEHRGDFFGCFFFFFPPSSVYKVKGIEIPSSLWYVVLTCVILF